MKKTYNKPAVVFESFELSKSIASGCEFFATQADPNNCTFKDPTTNWVIFLNVECDFGSDVVDDSEVCYNVPSDSKNVFAS